MSSSKTLKRGDHARLARVLFTPYRLFVSPALHQLSHLAGGGAIDCRFQPHCGQYAEDAVARFGVFRGLWLALRRFLRCHPFSRGGTDPVPCQTAVIRSS